MRTYVMSGGPDMVGVLNGPPAANRGKSGARFNLGDGQPFRDYNKKKPETNTISAEGIDHILVGLSTVVGTYIQKSVGGK
ncbi:MAG: hypothetical protein OHK0039_48800 [Bacteroidia bacterium]